MPKSRPLENSNDTCIQQKLRGMRTPGLHSRGESPDLNTLRQAESSHVASARFPLCNPDAMHPPFLNITIKEEMNALKPVPLVRAL